MIELAILAAVVLAAVAVGLLLRRNQGRVRPATLDPETAQRARLLDAAGVTGATPAVLHFSADWCGPCAAVRRVVGQVLARFEADPDGTPAATEVEVDIDEHPALAKTLGVLSLPTTFILDGALTERFRISGVPSAPDLETALAPLLETGRPNS